MASSKAWLNWVLFILLSLIWGSSFILMKLGMYTPMGEPVFSPYQVAALRILSAGIVLLPVMINNIYSLPKGTIIPVLLSGLLGNFLPAFLFCIAETKIDSSLAGSLNSLTPVFAIITGSLLWKQRASTYKVLGVLIGLAGCFGLLITKEMKQHENVLYSFFIILATISYGLNVNLVRLRLQGVGSMVIASFAFGMLIIPSAMVLLFSGFFAIPLGHQPYSLAFAAVCLLGVLGTAVAAILFYMLVKSSGSIFASTVSYGIPFVALGWGLLAGDTIGYAQVICLLVMLAGVWMANKFN